MKELKLVLSAAMRALFFRKKHLAIGLILPAIVYFVVREASQLMTSHAFELLIDSSEGIGSSGFLFKVTCIYLIEAAFISLAAIFIIISAHRVLLSRYVSKRLSALSVYIKFCWVTLCLFPVYSVVFSPFWFAYSNYKVNHDSSALLIFIGALILSFSGMLLISRVVLVFPSIAIGHSITMRKSMELTRPHKLLMAFVAAFVPFLLIGLNVAVFSYVQIPEIILSPFIYMRTLVFFLIEVSCLSMAYLYIIKINSQ